jgi:hypothetical protein
VSQIFHFSSPKGKFGIFDKQLVVLYQVNGFFHMEKADFPSAAVKENFIKENQDKLLKVRFQYFIHETLEGGWGIAKAKMHAQ